MSDRIPVRNPNEIAKLRRAGEVSARILMDLMPIVRPGITTKEIDNSAAELFRREKCGNAFLGYGGYPGQLCISVNEEVVHAIGGARVLRERAARGRAGVEILQRILGGPSVRIAVEANKPEAIAALEQAFAGIEGDVAVVVLPVLYPQGSEKHLIYSVTGRRVAPGALPSSVGCIVENVATIAAVADAVLDGVPLTARVTTVSGDGIAQPRNVLAPVGTSYADLVAFCGGEKPGVRKVVSGGTMMGLTVPNLDIPTTKTTSGLLLLTEARVFQYASSPCINCGRCIRACPMRLNPAALSRAVESDDIAAAEALGVMNCVECGACAFGCPAYRSITHHCRRAKNAIRARAAARKN